MLRLDMPLKIFLECSPVVAVRTWNLLVVVDSVHVNIECTLLGSLVVTKLARKLEALMN